MRDLIPFLPSFEASPAFVVNAAPLLAMLVVAAYVDWRSRRIPNWLTLSLLLAGLVRGAFAATLGLNGFGLGDAVLGASAGLGISLPLFVLGARGAGDAKLYAAAGAWLGWRGVVALFAVEAVVGLVVVVGQCAAKGKLGELLRNTGVLTTTLLHVRRVGVEQAARNGQTFTSIDKKLPHAVPFLAAVLVVLAVGMG